MTGQAGVSRGRNPHCYATPAKAGVHAEDAALKTVRRRYGRGEPETVRQESPERAEPSFVGVWGNPHNPPAPPRRGVGVGGCPERGRAHSRVPLRILETAHDLAEMGAIVTLICPVRYADITLLTTNVARFPPSVLSMSKHNWRYPGTLSAKPRRGD